MTRSQLAARILGCVVALNHFAVSPASADALYSGSITGIFTAPVLSGSILDPLTNTLVFGDNTATAVFTGVGTNHVTWGSNPTPTPGSPPMSDVSFVGSSFSNIAPSQPFELGRLFFTNGSTLSGTEIFGFTFTMSATLTGGGGVPITPFTSALSAMMTANVTTGPCQGIPVTLCKADSDFIEFPSLGIPPPVSFNVLEGASAQAILYGAIVGDPVLELLGIQVAPGSEESAFIGNGLNDFVAPEPTSLILVATGMLGLMRRFRRPSGRW
jgi:hypothetical protein